MKKLCAIPQRLPVLTDRNANAEAEMIGNGVTISLSALISAPSESLDTLTFLLIFETVYKNLESLLQTVLQSTQSDPSITKDFTENYVQILQSFFNGAAVKMETEKADLNPTDNKAYMAILFERLQHPLVAILKSSSEMEIKIPILMKITHALTDPLLNFILARQDFLRITFLETTRSSSVYHTPGPYTEDDIEEQPPRTFEVVQRQNPNDDIAAPMPIRPELHQMDNVAARLPGYKILFGDMQDFFSRPLEQIVEHGYKIGKAQGYGCTITFWGAQFYIPALTPSEYRAFLANPALEKGDLVMHELTKVLGPENVFVQPNSQANSKRAPILHSTAQIKIDKKIREGQFTPLIASLLEEIIPEGTCHISEAMTLFTTNFFGKTMLGLESVSNDHCQELAEIFGDVLKTIASTSIGTRLKSQVFGYHATQKAHLRTLYQIIFEENIDSVRQNKEAIIYTIFKWNQNNLVQDYIAEARATQKLTDAFRTEHESNLKDLGLLNVRDHVTNLLKNTPLEPFDFDANFLRIDDEELIRTIGLLHAGQETSTRILEACMYQLCKTPEYTQNIRAEIKHFFKDITNENFGERINSEFLSDKGTYLHRFSLEIYRLYGAVPQALRAFPEGGTINSTHERLPYTMEIPAGTQILLPLGPIKKSTEYVGENPDEFNPDRVHTFESSEEYTKFIELFTFLKSPGSVRQCPGRDFVSPEIKTAIAWIALKYNCALDAPNNGNVVSMGTLRMETPVQAIFTSA